MELKTMGQQLTFNDDYVKNHPDKCAKIKSELIQINEAYKIGKRGLTIKLSNHPLTIKGYHEERPRLYNRLYDRRDTGEPRIVFEDCLAGKDWVEKHYKDIIPEPTIDLIINGKATHFNNNYKPGLIKQTMRVKR